MVAMIIARTENVDDAVIAELDASIAGRAEKWMKLSKPKLRDRIDMWVAKMDPAGRRSCGHGWPPDTPTSVNRGSAVPPNAGRHGRRGT
jgi:hypothetical protein